MNWLLLLCITIMFYLYLLSSCFEDRFKYFCPLDYISIQYRALHFIVLSLRPFLCRLLFLFLGTFIVFISSFFLRRSWNFLNTNTNWIPTLNIPRMFCLEMILLFSFISISSSILFGGLFLRHTCAFSYDILYIYIYI